MSGHAEWLADLRSRFALAHQLGMACLERRDYDSLWRVIETERTLIDELNAEIQRTRRDDDFAAR